jgi:Cu/Ag efflux protein CusF
MPIAALVDRCAALEKLVDEFVERLDDFVAVRDSQSSAGTEIVLHIDYDQRLVWLSHCCLENVTLPAS